ncbi:MAG: DUF1566 domain-containing protein [Calditrichia bacterium]
MTKLLALLNFLVKIKQYLNEWWSSWRLSYFSDEDFQNATKYYIKPHCQKIDPATIIDSQNAKIKRYDLFETINYLLEQPDKYKYIMIFGETGTGKTSFLLNFYYEYKSLKLFKRTRIKVIPMGFVKNLSDEINKIGNKSNTVLCLDALDEDTLMHDSADSNKYQERIWEICQQTYEFRNVIITCRSQFFPKDVITKLSTNINKPGSVGMGESGEYTFKKLYISYFNNSQIREYLKKRFPGDQEKFQKSLNKANDLVGRIPELTMRPMILAYIDDLLNKNIDYTYQIYESIVDAWINREKYWENKDLRRLSEQLAVHIYTQSVKTHGVAAIPLHELQQFENGDKIKRWKISGRSLLNHDAEGNYKFAHRSIMEFLFVMRFLKMVPKDRPELLWTKVMVNFLSEILINNQYRSELNKLNCEKIDLNALLLFEKYKPIQLRREPKTISDIDAKRMILINEFFDENLNPKGKSLKHRFIPYGEKNKSIFDLATGLIWQQSGSVDELTWQKAHQYIQEINKNHTAGSNIWRLPTLDEAMSLMEAVRKKEQLYIDPVFDTTQSWIWTGDLNSDSVAWNVRYSDGICDKTTY